ncbi:DUF6489 family protein [Sneathiella aquimaris]|uniref:DUF6489 family protein n=1 Tax=Sneathiella aquimaris TaxID=2599305 RepID=UPI001469F157|nr:DUF6489 family protein [Sneathiella aquimaris]
MKIKLDIDCTPQEARTFFGLPDVEKMQEAMMKEIQDKMLEGVKTLDAESMMKTWMPTGMKNLDQMQNMFWSSFTGGSDKDSKE